MEGEFKKPEALVEGDKVGIIIPASPVKEPFRGEGLKQVAELGFVPVEVGDVLSKTPEAFLARPPEESWRDIQAFFSSADIKALWAGRGGYGSNLLLPLMRQMEIPQPKVVIGASDVSYLLWYFLDRLGMVVFYGPMAYSSLAEKRFNGENIKKVLSGLYNEIKIPGDPLVPGKARGIATGGCLSNLVSLLGSPYMPQVKGRILLLEDVGERPYRLDRMFWQLAQAGVFAMVRGLLLGEFPDCFKNAEEKKAFLFRVRQYVEEYRIPVIYGLPFGHSGDTHVLPLGVEVEIDTTRYLGLIIDEKGVRT